MKKILTLILLAVTFVFPNFAQVGSNDEADSIVGENLTDLGEVFNQVAVLQVQEGVLRPYVAKGQ